MSYGDVLMYNALYPIHAGFRALYMIKYICILVTLQISLYWGW